jgi:hypothetical protein
MTCYYLLHSLHIVFLVSHTADDERWFFLTRITYALTISPVAMSLEELIPANHAKSYLFSIFIRTGLVFSTLVIGLSVPFFGES